MFAQNEILSAVWKKLNADATLQGTSYLKSSGKIWTGSKRPMQTDNPLLTIEGSRQLHESRMERWQLLIKAYSDDADNGSVDITRLGNITDRVIDLLHNADMTISGVGSGVSISTAAPRRCTTLSTRRSITSS